MEKTDITLPERPSLFFNYGNEQVKMTYGLEMDIRRMLPDPRVVLHAVQNDPYTQDYLIRRVLTPAKKIITDPADLIPSEEVTLTSDETEALLKWVAEHALYFFMKRVLGVAELGTRYQAVLQKPSTDGSENSATTMPSAGPSE